MKPAPLLLSLVLCATATAQNPAAQKLALTRNPGMRCPIAMQARHDFFFRKDLVSANPSRQKRGDAARGESMQIRLTLTNSDPRRVTHARIIVRGTNGNWRTVPVGDATHKADLRETMDVTFEPGEGQDVDSYLALQGFTAIQSIALDTVTYGDGSTWKPAGACWVAPDPFMLVAAQ